MATYTMPPAVNGTRRITFRRLGQMNGDNLSQLRNPPRAEAARPLLGQLEAHRAGMKKQLDLWYKEQNFLINKINRGQAKVYKTFLRAHYDQRRLARMAAEKRRVQIALLSSNAEGDAGKKDQTPSADGVLTLETHAKLPPIKSVANQVSNADGNAEKALVEGKLAEHASDKTSKKYNRHRSEFSVVANAPAAITTSPKVDGTSEDLDAVDAVDAEETPIKISVTESRPPDRRAKVLVVRKQTPDGSNMKEGSTLSKHGGSFIKERSGSIYIQTVTMANEDIGETAATKMVDSDPEEGKQSVVSNIQPLQPSKSLIHENTLALPAISESKNPRPLPDRVSTNISTKQPKPSKQSPRKTTTHKLGELKVRMVKKKPAPPTSYTIAVVEQEKERERLAAAHAGTLSRLTRSEKSGSGADDNSRSETKSVSSKKAGTMAEYIRQRRLDRDREIKETLDRETPILYERDDHGEIVRSGYDFKRREFKRPSSREKRVRRKLLQQSREAQKEERERVVRYIDKLSEEERQERLERERRARQKEQDAAAAKAEAKKMRAAETDPGVLLRSLIRAFRKGGPTPDTEDPNSVSSLERCSYIRVYAADQRIGSASKRSSWKQTSAVGLRR